jgi:Methyltransferase domain
MASCRFSLPMPVLLTLKRAAWRLLHPNAAKGRRRRLLESLPKGAVCAEVGVWKGDFSARILEVVRPRTLHLIDPWRFVGGEGYEDARYGGKLDRGQAEMDALHDAVLERFEEERREGIVQVHRTPSVEAAGRFADGDLDFVYVDGDHTYEGVRGDLEAYAPKVRPGGLLAGDDYGVRGWWEDGVTRAVDEFVAAGRAEIVSLDENQFVLRVRGGY